MVQKYLCQKKFGPKKLLVQKDQGLQEIGSKKFGQNRVCNSWDIADMDKCYQDIYMFPGQLSPLSVLDYPRNLPLRFGQNWVGNSWDIAEFEFLWVVVGGLKSFSSQTQRLRWEFRLHWGFDNMKYNINDISLPLYPLLFNKLTHWNFCYLGLFMLNRNIVSLFVPFCGFACVKVGRSRQFEEQCRNQPI